VIKAVRAQTKSGYIAIGYRWIIPFVEITLLWDKIIIKLPPKFLSKHKKNKKIQINARNVEKMSSHIYGNVLNVGRTDQV